MKVRNYAKPISIVLALCILFTLLPGLPQAEAADSTAEVSTEATAAPEKIPDYQLEADCQLLTYVDEAVFAGKNHIARLPSEETLSSYAFLNSDGTKTVYYMNEEVKFIDADGAVVEKDVTLTAAADGYTTTRNDIQLTIPSNPANGIRLTYDGNYITLVPQCGTLATAAQATDSTVTYPDYFGSGMSLVYTPTLSGVKEDIVLQSYTGVNSFTFLLNTNGLNLYQAGGRYFLAESKLATRRYELGDVVAFDARGKFSIGTMTVTTVMPGQAYRLTITADEAFLTDPDTVYPVAIDPTITVSDNTHGAGAIEDTSIYSGRPNANGNWTYLHSGYYDSTYQVARTLVRLTGLTSDSTYQSLTSAEINSAQFHIREATGSPAQTVNLYANTGSSTWTESGATWNNAGITLGTVYATASAVSNSDTVYDITSLVKAWKNGTQTAAKGFVLVSSNETSVDKAFYSSEFGTTSYRPYVVVTYTTNVTPVVADGVYRIISKSANLPIGSDRSIANLTNVATQATYSTNSEQFYQLWKITHLGNNLYSVRPLHKLDMALDVTGTNVDVYKIGYTDSLYSIPTYAQWKIESTANGYSFKKNGSDSAAMMTAAGAYPGLNVSVGNYSASSSQYHFALSPVSPAPGALMLFSTSTKTLFVSSFASDIPVISTGLGGTKTPEQIGFIPSVCDAYNSSQAMTWSSSNTNVATIHSSTGAVTPISMGETVISASRSINGTSYSVRFKLVVTIPDGTYFIKSKSSGLYTDIYAQNMAANTVIHQWVFHGGNSQRWVFTNLGDGTFTIHSANSTTKYYLGVSGDSSANNQAIVLRTGTVTNGMKWKIAKTSSGAYKLIPLTGEADGRVLALETGILGIANSNGDVLQQRDYVDDTNYKDEWIICEYDTSILLAMEHSDGGDRDDYFTNTAASLQTEKNGIVSVVSTASYSSCSVSSMLNYLQNNNIFFIHTHGEYDKFMISENSYLTIQDLDNVDLSNVKFALLLACNTGVGYSDSHIENNTPYNIIEKMVICGAESVVGFNDETRVDDCNVFAVEISKKLILEECSIRDALNRLDIAAFKEDIVGMAVKAGNADNKLR